MIINLSQWISDLELDYKNVNNESTSQTGRTYQYHILALINYAKNLELYQKHKKQDKKEELVLFIQWLSTNYADLPLKENDAVVDEYLKDL